MSILHRRLQEALNGAKSIVVETAAETWQGIPTYLDDEWVELWVNNAREESGEIEMHHQNWLIRLDRIEVIAYPSEKWDAARLTAVASSETGEI